VDDVKERSISIVKEVADGIKIVAEGIDRPGTRCSRMPDEHLYRAKSEGRNRVIGPASIAAS
jgi:PleD family two-component response regulator